MNITCLPKAIKDKLLEVIHEQIPYLNNKAIDDTQDDSNPQIPNYLENTLKFGEELKDIPEC